MITYEIAGLMLLVVAGCGYTSYNLGFKRGVVIGNISTLHLLKEYLRYNLGKEKTSELLDNELFERWLIGIIKE